MNTNTYYIDESIQSFVKEELKKNNSEVFSTIYDEKKIWIKRARGTSSSFVHKLFFKIFKYESLTPVQDKSSANAVLFESKKLIKFKQLGIPTPSVMAFNHEYMVLEDCGRMVNSYIRKRDISQEKMYYFIDKILLELSKIHNSNEFHGGAQARNFTYKDGSIFVIDLEDSFDINTDKKFLQFRDLLLFLLSLTKTRASFEIDYKYVIDKYIELVPSNSDFFERLYTLADKISFLITLSQKNFIQQIIGRDGKGFFKLFIELKNLKNSKGK